MCFWIRIVADIRVARYSKSLHSQFRLNCALSFEISAQKCVIVAAIRAARLFHWKIVLYLKDGPEGYGSDDGLALKEEHATVAE